MLVVGQDCVRQVVFARFVASNIGMFVASEDVVDVLEWTFNGLK